MATPGHAPCFGYWARNQKPLDKTQLLLSWAPTNHQVQADITVSRFLWPIVRHDAIIAACSAESIDGEGAEGGQLAEARQGQSGGRDVGSVVQQAGDTPRDRYKGKHLEQSTEQT